MKEREEKLWIVQNVAVQIARLFLKQRQQAKIFQQEKDAAELFYLVRSVSFVAPAEKENRSTQQTIGYVLIAETSLRYDCK